MEKIGVFLSSNSDVDAAYTAAAEQLGAWIGQHGKTLVYGGMTEGLMEVLAQAVKRNGGFVSGLIPAGDYWKNKQSKAVDFEILCTGLADRKQSAVQESDILIALPGGVGTLDEVFTTVATAFVGEHNKKVILYNVSHCWDKLIDLLQDLKRQKMIFRPLENYITVVDNFEALTTLLEKN